MRQQFLNLNRAIENHSFKEAEAIFSIGAISSIDNDMELAVSVAGTFPAIVHVLLKVMSQNKEIAEMVLSAADHHKTGGLPLHDESFIDYLKRKMKNRSKAEQEMAIAMAEIFDKKLKL
jgi:hypothetical protein